MNLQAKLDAVKRDPDNAELWVKLGQHLEKDGQIEEARSSYQRALQIDPTREALYEEMWKLETHNALPSWFDKLNQSVKSAHYKPVTERASATQPRAVFSQTKAILLIAVIFTLLISVPLYLLVGPESNKTIEVKAPNGTTLMIPEATLNARGQTTDDAVELGYPLLLKDGIRLTIKEPYLEASERFEIRYLYRAKGQEENEWYDEPPANMRPYVLRIMAENVSSDDGYLSLTSYGAVQDKKFITYDQDCGSSPNEIMSSVPRDERTEGNVCFLVAEEAEIEYFIYDSYNEVRFFKLKSD